MGSVHALSAKAIDTSPQEWRAKFQGALAVEQDPRGLNADLVRGITSRAWAKLVDERGRSFRTFDAFCLAPRPWGLEVNAHKVRAFLEGLVGKRRASLVLVRAAAPGKRSDLEPGVTRVPRSKREERLRCIAERCPASIAELYAEGVLGQKEAERFGRKQYPPEVATAARRFLKRAERMVKRGLPVETSAREKLRLAVGREARAVFANAPTTEPGPVAAMIGDSADILATILRLHVRAGSTVADVTHGPGVMWRNISAGTYQVLGTDLVGGVDCRTLPYESGTIDVVLLDPPFRRNAWDGSADLQHAYRNGERAGSALALYKDALTEAKRVLRRRGLAIIKCQDQFGNRAEQWTHLLLCQHLEHTGWRLDDLLFQVRKQAPLPPPVGQARRARRNYSVWLVARNIGSPEGRIAGRFATKHDK